LTVMPIVVEPLELAAALDAVLSLPPLACAWP
jgi:hypothetical protein